MSFFKYYNQKQDSDGEPLWWPGGPEGYPFRGQQPPQTKKEEFDQLALAGKARVRLFHLDKEEDLKAYIEVRDKCANSLYILLDRDRVWDEDTKNYRIYLEWLELGYDMPPPERNDAVQEYIKQPQGTSFPFGRLAGLRNGSTGW
jgi:hypothetical protein